MPHINLGNDMPGIISLFQYRPETAGPLNELADFLLHKPNTLEPWERELIAAHVSGLNDCQFCTDAHAAFAAAQAPEGLDIDVIRANPGLSPISGKLKALLAIAGAVQQGGLHVTTELVDQARAAGAVDLEIHDTVLIAAAFCMINRYVDGLGTTMPDDPGVFAARAAMMAEARRSEAVSLRP